MNAITANHAGQPASIELADQFARDQKRYSRYVCDARAIPNVIDGLKPVQRRILWTMWNSSAREHSTKTVKVAGMVMAYHPHGNASIEDAIAQMVQSFPFTNNYPLISGEGTFGDVLDPKAIASPRYTEVKLSEFAKELGLFESLADIDYASNYDATTEEPICFIPKVPLILLNPILGIATGFKCCMPPRKLAHVAEKLLYVLDKKPNDAGLAKLRVAPWVKGYHEDPKVTTNEQGVTVFTTHFGFSTEDNKLFLTATPHNWAREKTILYLEQLIKEGGGLLRDYEDYSRADFKIELIFKRGTRITSRILRQLFAKETRDFVDQNVITSTGQLKQQNDGEIIAEFLNVRIAHLKRRFKRLEQLEHEKHTRESELLRFIREKWNVRLVTLSNRAALLKALSAAHFTTGEWLAGLPLYRLTQAEAKRAQAALGSAKIAIRRYARLQKYKSTLHNFMREEIETLVKRWDS